MAMFDYVKMEYKLPPMFAMFNRKAWQTYDFKLWDPSTCELQDVVITEEGRINHIQKDGTLKRVGYTGKAFFVNSKGDVNKERTYKWTEICLTFDRGVVVPDSLRVEFCGLLKNRFIRDKLEKQQTTTAVARFNKKVKLEPAVQKFAENCLIVAIKERK